MKRRYPISSRGFPTLLFILFALFFSAHACVWPAQTCCPDGNSIITTVAGTGTGGYTGDGGPATSAQLIEPNDVLVDSNGNLFISDAGNNVVRKVSPAGIITTVVGTGIGGYTGDGGPATLAQLAYPTYIAEDSSGNIYICDSSNDCIRKVSPSGIITTFAGNGTPGYSGDGGPATSALLFNPYGVAVDGAGNVFIADDINYAIRKVTPSGIITTIAGNGTPGYSGDGGPAVSALMESPEAISIDPSGNLFFYDDDNGYVRKIDTAGIITSVFNTTGADTEGIAFCGGNLYLSGFNHQIREVTAGGATVIAGTGVASESGDGGPASLATLNGPNGMCMDSLGNLYVADRYGNTVRKIAPVCPPTPTATVSIPPGCDEFHVSRNCFSPNQGAVSIDVNCCAYPGHLNLRIYNSAGEHIRTLDDRQLNAPFQASYSWDGTNKSGDPCASGIYILQLMEPFDQKTKRLLLVR